MLKETIGDKISTKQRREELLNCLDVWEEVSTYIGDLIAMAYAAGANDSNCNNEPNNPTPMGTVKVAGENYAKDKGFSTSSTLKLWRLGK